MRRVSSPGPRTINSIAVAFGKSERRHLAAEGGDGRHLLDGIPEQERARREAALSFLQSADEARQLARLLERRIDQHHPAPLGRRQQRLQGRPSIERHHPHLRVVRKKPFQLVLVFGMQLVDDQAIVGAHQLAGEQRATGIAQQRTRLD